VPHAASLPQVGVHVAEHANGEVVLADAEYVHGGLLVDDLRGRRGGDRLHAEAGVGKLAFAGTLRR